MFDAFKALMKIRSHIIDGGNTFDYEYAKNALNERDLLSYKTADFLADKKVDDYEKLQTVKRAVCDFLKFENFLGIF